MEPWWLELEQGNVEAAWDLFIARYRRLILATIRRTCDAHDELLDAFSHVCQALSADELRVLRRYTGSAEPRAAFSTWLVIVVRNQTIDWVRARSGRPRVTVPQGLSPFQREIFQHVFVERRAHVEAYEILRSSGTIDVSFDAYLREVAETYRVVGRSGARALLRHFAPAPTLEPAEPPHPHELLLISEARRRLDAVLESLPLDTRLALKLFVEDGVPAAEVAQALGWQTAKDVYNRVYRALDHLRQTLERQGVRRDDL